MPWLLFSACATVAEPTLALSTEPADECRNACVLAELLDGEGQPIGGQAVSASVDGVAFGASLRTSPAGKVQLCGRGLTAGLHALSFNAGYTVGEIDLDIRAFGTLDSVNRDPDEDSAVAWTPAFERVGRGPVLLPGQPDAWDGVAVALPTVAATPEGYAMWYAGSAGGDYVIGAATSPDGLTWTRAEGNPLLTPGAEGSWNQYAVNAPMLLADDAGWSLYFDGRSEEDGNLRIGLAAGSDPLAVEQVPESPVFTWSEAEAEWAGKAVAHPSVQRDADGVWHLWYSTGGQQVGYAYSHDGRSWARYCQNPVLTGGTEANWEAGVVKSAEVIRVGDHWVMSYSGGGPGKFALGWATSRDGLHWQAAPSPVLRAAGEDWERQAVFGSAMLVVGSDLWMWYTGADGTGSSVGLAVAPLPGGA